MTEEEIFKALAAGREVLVKSAVEKGCLPDNPGYAPVQQEGMEAVEANPEKYIMPECLPACKVLWEKNIYTYMVSDSVDFEAWIEVKMSALSPENLEYLLSLEAQGVHLFRGYHEGTIQIGVGCFGEKAQRALLEIANGFKMQDVQRGYDLGYVGLEEGLFLTGCIKEIPNPKYIDPMTVPENERWKLLLESESEPTIRVFDETKVKDPIEKNFEGTGLVFVLEEERVYLSEYHYRKHLNYLKSLEEKNEMGDLSF